MGTYAKVPYKWWERSEPRRPDHRAGTAAADAHPSLPQKYKPYRGR